MGACGITKGSRGQPMSEVSGLSEPSKAADQPLCRVDVRWREDGSASVVLAGEFDIAAVDDVRAALNDAISAGRADVRVDMSELRFCGAAGMTVLAEAHRALDEQSRRLRIEQASADVRQGFVLGDAGWLLDLPM